ncbi:hypothetical protein FBU59_001357 [Linderina macrospora]|uniref:Uncharacterized protein n=1 Tax=Linderina macrospora TaxID=4868 RepID=A0ACC1JEC1_9FUNG|nr:hypothetical protein FBU59_001357 [Linderina macrospora]
MYDYYTQKPGTCHATFLLSGTQQSGKSSQLLVKIVSEDELAEAKQGLSNVSSHIYSLERRKVDADALVASNLAAGSIREMADLAAIRNGFIKQCKSGSSAAFAKPAAVSKPKEIKKETPACERSEDVAMEEPAMPAKKATTSFFGRQTVNRPAKKQEVKKEPKEIEPAKKKQEPATIKKEPTPAKSSASTGKLVKVPSPSSVEPPSSPASKLGRMRVEDMFADDDDDDFEDTRKSEPESAAEPEQESEPAVLSNQAPSDTQDDMDIDNTDDLVKEEPTETPQSGGSRRVRKRRKVSRVKHTKNSRGMLVSETVDEWESYSESEPEVLSKPTRKSVAKPAAAEPEAAGKSKRTKGKPVANQRSLLSFFGKK